jgi:Rieske Fe-S protein
MIDRRTILKGITAIPILAVLGGVGASLLSFLKPNLKPLSVPTAEVPQNKDLVAASLDEFPKEWDVKEFVFTQITPEYSSKGTQQTDIPGYILRVPKVPALDPTKIGDLGSLREGYGEADHKGTNYSMVVISRICAHLGCIFEYHTGDQVCTGFNYCGESVAVKGKAGHPLFSCPCHLSVYNPVEVQDVSGVMRVGRVVSGPAPRTPFPFRFVIDNGNVIIKGYG